MKNIILFDGASSIHLYPLTLTRPVAELRMGILTNTERWALLAKSQQESDFERISWHTNGYLQGKYPTQYAAINHLIHGALIADPKAWEAVAALRQGEVLTDGNGEVLAACFGETDAQYFLENSLLLQEVQYAKYEHNYLKIKNLWHIFQQNAKVLRLDFDLVTKGRQSQPLSSSNILIGDPQNLFIEEGAVIEGSVLNVKDAPIYIGKNAEIMEACSVRNGLALCNDSALKMGTRIYGATTIGQHSKVGGEINNSVIIGYSNKAHDGFLGNSVLGEWCNLGAGTNNSNLKNNYGEVQLWSYKSNSFENTGTQFCGLMMGDHSKCSISTMFNTGTVVGVSVNVFGDGFPRKFVPSFAWGGAKGFSTYELDKAFETAQLVMERRHLELTETDKAVLKAVFDFSAPYRMWEKR